MNYKTILMQVWFVLCYNHHFIHYLCFIWDINIDDRALLVPNASRFSYCSAQSELWGIISLSSFIIVKVQFKSDHDGLDNKIDLDNRGLRNDLGCYEMIFRCSFLHIFIASWIILYCLCLGKRITIMVYHHLYLVPCKSDVICLQVAKLWPLGDPL